MTEMTNPMFRALRSLDVDPDLAYEVVEYVHHEAGQNVIDVLGAQIDTLKAELRADLTELRAEVRADLTEVRADLKVQSARIEALDSRIDTLQKVIWPLVVSLAVALMTSSAGLVYQLVTS